MNVQTLSSSYTFDNKDYKLKAEFLINPFLVGGGPCSSSRKAPCCFRKKCSNISSYAIDKSVGVKCAGCGKELHLLCYFNKMKINKMVHIQDSDGLIPVCGNRCHKTKTKMKKETAYKRWNNDNIKESGLTSMSILLNWITVEENAMKYVHCKTSPGKTVIDMRMDLVKSVSDEIFEKLGLQRSVSSIVQKITTLETSYRGAAGWMRQTGAGVQEEGGDFRTYLLKLCPYFEALPLLR